MCKKLWGISVDLVESRAVVQNPLGSFNFYRKDENKLRVIKVQLAT